MKRTIKRIPIVGDLARRAYRILSPAPFPGPFPGSKEYWEQRYAKGGTSGVGSYGLLAEFKADVLNEFVRTHAIRTVIEFGCGDGHQLSLAQYPDYDGYDVSRTAIARCRKLFASDGSKKFGTMVDYEGRHAELALSLDVIYHLVEDSMFEDYMQMLFAAADRFVIIYSSDTDDNPEGRSEHVRHRKFTKWVEKSVASWMLVQRLPNRYPYRGDHNPGSWSDFFVYEKQ